MKDLIPEKLVDLAREIVRAEGLTTPGRVNLFFSVMLVVMVGVASLAINVLQAIVRIWRPDYTTGFPEVVSWILTVGLFGFCLVILALLEVKVPNQKK